MSELMLLSEVVCNPGGFDSLANYVGEVPDDGWLYVLSRTRDSDALEESNFRVALKRLGGEGENVEVLRFRHWACGWLEHIGVRVDSEESLIAEGIVDSLEVYPVLCDLDYSAAELEYGELCERCYHRAVGS